MFIGENPFFAAFEFQIVFYMHEQTHVDCIQSIDNCQLIEFAKKLQARAQCGIFVKARTERSLNKQWQFGLFSGLFKHC